MCHIWSQRNSAEIIDVCCENALQGARFGYNGRNVIQKNNSLLSVGNVGCNAEWSSSYQSRDFNLRRVFEWNIVQIWGAGLCLHVKRVVWELVPKTGDKKAQQAESRLDSKVCFHAEKTHSQLSSNQGKRSGTLGLQRGWKTWYTTQPHNTSMILLFHVSQFNYGVKIQAILQFVTYCKATNLGSGPPHDFSPTLAFLHVQYYILSALQKWFKYNNLRKENTLCLNCSQLLVTCKRLTRGCK